VFWLPVNRLCIQERQSALHIASRLGNIDNVVLLLQHGASPDSATHDLYTALHIAAKEGHEEVVRILLEHGANQTLMTNVCVHLFSIISIILDFTDLQLDKE